MRLHFTIRAALFALALLLVCSGAVLAQEETAATVTGLVTDSTGAVVKDATVVITNDQTKQERRVQTNEDGQFVLTPLIPGTYTLTVEQTSFKKHIEAGLTLNAKDRRSINVVLEVGNVSESVTVTRSTSSGIGESARWSTMIGSSFWQCEHQCAANTMTLGPPSGPSGRRGSQGRRHR